MPKINHDQFYLQAYYRYGITPKGICWRDTFSQEIRFFHMYTSVKKILTDKTLVDCGCGFGDFYIYLQNKGVILKQYIGIEEQSEFVKIAKQRTKQQILHGNCLDIDLPIGDFYFCSGTLNTLEQFESYLFLQRMIQHASIGVGFNFLVGKKQSKVYNYLEEKALESIVLEHNMKIVYKKKDYIPFDCTIVALHDHVLK